MSTKNAEQRMNTCFTQIKSSKSIWILTDDDGCVMLNTEEEDCVPVWPEEASALEWATGEWENCQAKEIDLKTWLSRWTDGLSNDELAIAVHPIPEEDGILIDPYEFADAIA